MVDVDIKGSLLKKVLNKGKESAGNGAYLQLHKLTQNENGEWMIAGRIIEDEETYAVILNDFLLMGRDIDFLNNENPGFMKIMEAETGTIGDDMRKAIISYIKTIK